MAKIFQLTIGFVLLLFTLGCLSCNNNSGKENSLAENPDSVTSIPGSATRALATAPNYTKYTLFDLNGNDLGNVSGFEVPAKFPKGTYIIRAEANGQVTVSKKVSR